MLSNTLTAEGMPRDGCKQPGSRSSAADALADALRTLEDLDETILKLRNQWFIIDARIVAGRGQWTAPRRISYPETLGLPVTGLCSSEPWIPSAEGKPGVLFWQHTS